MYIRNADTDAVIDAFGKNKQLKKSVLNLVRRDGLLVLARVVDPVTDQQVVGMITHCGVNRL